MTFFEMLLWIFGGLGVIVLICKFVLWAERYYPEENYDERQQMARGNGYRVCFYISVIWLLAALLLWNWLEEAWMFLFVGLGLQVQFMTFYIYCFLTHAAVPLSSKPKSMICGKIMLAVYYGLKTAASVRQDAQFPQKPPVSTLFQLSIAVGFATMAVLHLIQHLRDRKE